VSQRVTESAIKTGREREKETDKEKQTDRERKKGKLEKEY
jgi:hypothetical protein